MAISFVETETITEETTLREGSLNESWEDNTIKGESKFKDFYSLIKSGEFQGVSFYIGNIYGSIDMTSKLSRTTLQNGIFTFSKDSLKVNSAGNNRSPSVTELFNIGNTTVKYTIRFEDSKHMSVDLFKLFFDYAGYKVVVRGHTD